MNKYQEAIDIINRVAFKQYEDVCYSKTKKSRAMNYESLLKRSADTLQELVDKETPTKTSKSHCGKCNIGYLVQSRGDKYCHVCGYKIDWSDGD